ncbi:Omp28-related outer membrane protein [Polluticoccus soli]|uniref:Omp28-related outer membrane protein n=1 Tax=Polluticoccus soli TaxID=3034150 RepID=UPI0023E0F169|nr:Omp28-related outer membrane protein [Flavipsychrobacter sp. JY13-12]
MNQKLIPFVAAILLAHSALAQDFAAVAVSPLENQVPGNPKFTFTFERKGAAAANNCTIGWRLDNGTPQTVTKNASNLYWSGPFGVVRDAAFTVSLPSPGMYTLKAWIKTTNPLDNNAANDTVTQVIKVHQTLPKKNVVLEVFKHQGCAPCYPAALYLDTFVSKNPAYAIVQTYNGANDALYNTEGSAVDAQYGGFAHPMALYDRFKFPFKEDWGHMFVNQNGKDTLREFGERAAYYEPVLVWFRSTSYNESTRELKVKVAANFFADYSGDYRFNLYVTEDDVKGFQSSAPDVNNYYHKHVLRSMVGGSWGQQGSLPAAIKNGEYHDYEFTYTIPAGYNTGKLRLIGLVQAYNTNDKQRTILNSDQKTFAQALSVHDAAQLPKVQIYPNPVHDKLTITFGNTPLQTCRVTLLDMTGKLCRTVQCTGNTTIDVQGLAPGSYLLHIDDGNVVHTQTIVKQ